MSRITDDCTAQNIDQPDIVQVFGVEGATVGPVKPRTSVEPLSDDTGIQRP